MELTFNKVDNKYEAEFELSADANLHVEFKNAASIKLYQRTTGSGWDLVNDVKNAVGKATDVDLVSLIYPKFVKVVCVQEPTYATVTSDGEITEIKAQTKEIEVTSNGTTEVTPDAGFSYLNSVKVKTNVPTSGGGGVEIDPLTEYYLSEPQDVVWDASTEEGCKQAFETLWPLIERCGFDFFDNGGKLSLKPWFKSLSIIGGLEEADCNTIVNYKYRREGEGYPNYDFIVFNPYGEFALKKFYNGDGSVKSYSCGFFE